MSEKLEALIKAGVLTPADVNGASIATPPVLRQPMSPFDVRHDAATLKAIAEEIEQLNQYLATGKRGYVDVPLGHVNAIKAAFETTSPAWTVHIVRANPTFAQIWFQADGEPKVLHGEPALILLERARKMLAETLADLREAASPAGSTT